MLNCNVLGSDSPNSDVTSLVDEPFLHKSVPISDQNTHQNDQSSPSSLEQHVIEATNKSNSNKPNDIPKDAMKPQIQSRIASFTAQSATRVKQIPIMSSAPITSNQAMTTPAQRMSNMQRKQFLANLGLMDRAAAAGMNFSAYDHYF